MYEVDGSSIVKDGETILVFESADFVGLNKMVRLANLGEQEQERANSNDYESVGL